MLNDGVYGTSIFPSLLCKKIVVPTTSVLQLFTTPYTLITGVPGKVILPDKCFVTKQAGTAYVINGATLNFSWNGSTVWSAFATLTGFIDVTTLASILVCRPTLVGFNNTVAQPSIISGQSLTVHNSAANFTVGTGDLNFWITFRVFSFNELGWI